MEVFVYILLYIYFFFNLIEKQLLFYLSFNYVIKMKVWYYVASILLEDTSFFTMKKITPEIETKMPLEAIPPISSDVNFISNTFPKYKLWVDHWIYQDLAEDNHSSSLKDVIEESSNFPDHNKCISVDDLASKSDKNLSITPDLSNKVPLFIFSYGILLILLLPLIEISIQILPWNLPKVVIWCFLSGHTGCHI